jgi:hypothetical protein
LKTLSIHSAEEESICDSYSDDCDSCSASEEEKNCDSDDERSGSDTKEELVLKTKSNTPVLDPLESKQSTDSSQVRALGAKASKQFSNKSNSSTKVNILLY